MAHKTVPRHVLITGSPGIIHRCSPIDVLHKEKPGANKHVYFSLSAMRTCISAEKIHNELYHHSFRSWVRYAYDQDLDNWRSCLTF